MADSKDVEGADNIALMEQEAKLKEFELRRKMKTTVVPTDDGKVRVMLRQLGEPITLFGEREMERRERLRKLVAQQDAEVPIETAVLGQMVVEQVTQTQKEKFYTEGPEQLKEARLKVAHWSVSRAAARIAGQKRTRDSEDERKTARQSATAALASIKQLAQQSSEIADERPVQGCEFSRDGSLLATCGWGGMLSVWKAQGCQKQFTVRAHEERCTGVCWHPGSGTWQSPEAANIATASADCTAKVFNASGAALRTYEGHTDRLARLAFHPMGSHLATASYDATWRLWDVETGESLLEQEGHSRSVYTVAFHPDGSLVGSAGLDSIGRVWDCRTGRGVFVMEGHIKPILAMDFSPNGYHVVTGSVDHTCKVWDLRQKKCMYTIPGHRNLVSSVRFEHNHGQYIVSGGYDCLLKLWSGRDFSLVKTLAGHEGKVMCVDVSSDGSHTLASVSYDRTLKLWSPEEVPDITMLP